MEGEGGNSQDGEDDQTSRKHMSGRDELAEMRGEGDQRSKLKREPPDNIETRQNLVSITRFLGHDSIFFLFIHLFGNES